MIVVGSWIFFFWIIIAELAMVPPAIFEQELLLNFAIPSLSIFEQELIPNCAIDPTPLFRLRAITNPLTLWA